MPLRNLFIILVTIGVCLACHSAASKSRYANMFAEAMRVVETESLKVVPREQLFTSAMDGMLSELDRHSIYISGNAYQRFDESLRQQFGGVGIYVDSEPDNSALVILASSPDTPAAEAGLISGDRIVEINGESTKGLVTSEGIKKLKGPIGESVSLSILRGNDTFPVDLVRRTIPVASVHGDFRNEGAWVFHLEDHPRIGYVRLRQFGEQTADELSDALASVSGKVDSIIIDLRNNSGGLLTSAIRVCDMFLDEDKDIVRINGRGGRLENTHLSTKDREVNPAVPVIVLVNRESASASEIVAGCLQDHERATIVGEQSWGKGTVQNVIPIRPNHSAIKITTASYSRPSGTAIDREDPDVVETGHWGVWPEEEHQLELSQIDVSRNRLRRQVKDIRTLIPVDKRKDVLKLLTIAADKPVEGSDATKEERIKARDLLSEPDRVMEKAIELLSEAVAKQAA